MKEKYEALKEAAMPLMKVVREISVEFWQIAREAAVDGTKEFFAPLTGYCKRCEDEKKRRDDVRLTKGDYPDW
ncbi:MAG: hypothetical protein HGA31_01945 [Candidatus Moranbacteria bacterium]|nr:hypothetical protein [Candidatus Moranbacteria bacterium]